MSSIDERIVEMKFNNAQFESGVKTSTDSLGKLKKGLDLNESAKSLSNLQGVGDRFSLANIGNGVEQIASRFTNLGVVGVAALATIASKAVDVGIGLVKSLTVDHLADGFKNYEEQINATQTILSNTQADGTNLKDVTAVLKELNTYANQTVYNFSDMAKNIGTFTAAGVKLKPAVASIKGIANLAALSGSNAEQASGAMYQLSQAIAAGSFKLQDYNSVVNAGLGGKVFQTAIINTARANGVAVDSIIKKAGSFRAALQTGFVSSKILTQTLSQFTGDLSKKQLISQGYTVKQAAAILKLGITARNAATQIKTGTQLVQALGEEIASAYASIFKTLFGNIDQAKTLFSAIHNELENDLTGPIYAFGKALDSWASLGGRTKLIHGLSDAFAGLKEIVQPIEKALTDVFPPVTGKQLYSLTLIIGSLADKFEKFASAAGPDLYRTFRGVFSLLDIGRQIIIGLLKMVVNLFSGFSGGTSSVLDITAAIGDFFYNLDQSIKNGTGLTTFFTVLGRVIKVPISLIGALVGAIADLVTGFSNANDSKFGDVMGTIGAKVKPLTAATTILAGVWTRFGAALGRIFNFAQPIIKTIGDQLGNLGSTIASGLSSGNFQPVLDVLNTGLLGGITLLIAKFFKNGFNLNFSADLGGGLFGSIKETFEGLTGTLQAMQAKLKAQTLLTIAGAIAVLTVSVVALSLIDSAALTKALTAITVMFTELGAALTVFQKLASGPGFAKMPVLAASLILLGIAIDVLAVAVKKLSGIDFPGLVKGLGGVLVLLGGVAATANLVKGASLKLLPVAAGMILLAFAIRELANSVAVLGKLDVATISKGLGAVVVIMAAIVGFTKTVGDPKKIILTATGMVIIGAALQLFSSAVASLGALDVNTLAKGLGAMGIALAIVSVALEALPANSILGAAGLVVAAAGLVILAGALKAMGDLSLDEIGKALGVMAASLIILAASLILMTEALPGAAALIVAAEALVILVPALKAMGDLSIDEIGKALGTLAAGLAIIAVSLILMTEALPGAAALLVASAALAILAPVLAILGGMSWDEIGRGLAVLAGAFLVIGVAGALLTPVIPTLLGLGLAITLLGVGLAAAGIGVLAFAVGLTALGAAGAAGAAGLTIAFSAILGLIPLAAKEIGLGIVALAGVIGDNAPTVVSAIVKLVSALLNGLQTIIPKAAKVIVTLIGAILDGLGVILPKLANVGVKIVVAFANSLASGVPKVVSAGLRLVTGVLTAIAGRIGRVVTAGVSVVVAFINGVANNIGRVINAGADLIVKFVNGVAGSIRTHAAAMRAAGANLGAAIISGMTGGISDHIGEVLGKAGSMAQSVIDTVAHVLDSHSPSKEFIKLGQYVADGFAIGIEDGTRDQVDSALSDMSDRITSLISSTQSDIDSFNDKISSTKDAITKDSAAIDKQKAVLAAAVADRKSGNTVDKDTVKIQQLTAARARDTAAIKKAQAASTASYKKDGDAKRAAARIQLRSAQASLSANAQSIKEAKAKLAKDKADRKNGTTVAAAQKQLNALTKNRNADNQALKDAQASLKDSTAENLKAQQAQDAYTASLAANQAQLDDLSSQNDSLTDQIKDQTQAVADATKTRDDYNDSLKSQYSTLSDIATDTSVTDYFNNLEDQVTKVNEFATSIQELRNRGLNDTAYQKLLSEGTDSLPFINQLLNMGQDGVSEFDSLTDQLASASSGLASTASTNLYEAGVQAAQGLLDGLNSKQADIQAQIAAIANTMTQTIKDALGIASPSKVFKKIGGFSGDGLVEGLNNSISAVSDASNGLGAAAIDSLKSSLSGISDAVDGEMELQPTVKPILDLSAVQTGASGIAGLLGGNSVAVDATYSSASAASNGYASNQQALIAAKTDVAGSTSAGVTFIQNNNSPKALSQVELYRQTKNQLSVIQGKD